MYEDVSMQSKKHSRSVTKSCKCNFLHLEKTMCGTLCNHIEYTLGSINTTPAKLSSFYLPTAVHQRLHEISICLTCRHSNQEQCIHFGLVLLLFNGPKVTGQNNKTSVLIRLSKCFAVNSRLKSGTLRRHPQLDFFSGDALAGCHCNCP